MKIIYSAMVIIVGILISAAVKDIVGFGYYIGLGITLFIVFKIWSKDE